MIQMTNQKFDLNFIVLFSQMTDPSYEKEK